MRDRGGDRRRRRMGGGAGYDPDAQAYFDAVTAAGGSLSTLEMDAYNTYRVDAKENANAWNSDTIADYPMLGSSNNSCKINAQNPGTFDGTFVNTVAGDFTATGWTPNGTDSYMETGIIPSVNLIENDVCFEYYSRATASNSAATVWGSANGGTQRILCLFNNGGETQMQCYHSTGLGVADANNIAGYTWTRRASNDMTIYENGISIATTGTAVAGTVPTVELYLGARNNLGAADLFADVESAGALCANGLTVAQILAQYTARNVMNTTLSRNV